MKPPKVHSPFLPRLPRSGDAPGPTVTVCKRSLANGDGPRWILDQHSSFLPRHDSNVNPSIHSSTGLPMVEEPKKVRLAVTLSAKRRPSL